MPKELSIGTERKEIRKILKHISDNLFLSTHDYSRVDNFISIRYLLRKSSFTTYCKRIQSTSEGINRCKECDKKLIEAVMKKKEPAYHVCHAGLVDFCFPVKQKGNIIPMIGGQILFQPLNPETEQAIMRRIEDLGLKRGEIKEALQSVPVIPLQAVKTLMALLSSVLEDFSALEIADVLTRLSGDKSRRKDRLNEIVAFLRENYRKQYSLDEIAERLSISSYYLEHLFKKEFGISVIAYRNHLRLLAAKELLKSTSVPVTRIAFDLGWNDSNYFSNYFRKETGLSPSAYRKES